MACHALPTDAAIGTLAAGSPLITSSNAKTCSAVAPPFFARDRQVTEAAEIAYRYDVRSVSERGYFPAKALRESSVVTGSLCLFES